jgi:hypothetical protein
MHNVEEDYEIKMQKHNVQRQQMMNLHTQIKCKVQNEQLKVTNDET